MMTNINLIKDIKTPAFVYCLDTLDEAKVSIQSVLDNISEGNWIAYSYKTNPLLAAALAGKGCAMQVTSVSHLAEVQKFLDQNSLKKSFYCSGSITVGDARQVVKSGLHIVVDSESQLNCIEEAARQIGVKARVLIRVDAGESAANSPFGTSGMLQGVDIRKLEQILNKSYENIRIVGVHNHFGSQVASLDAWKKNIECIASVLRDIRYPLEILNLGGGTPINYDALTVPTIEQIYEHSLMPSIRAIQEAHPNINLVVEPGRYLVGPCGFLVATATNLHKPETKQGVNLDVSLFASFQDRFLSNLTFQLPVISPLSLGDDGALTILRGSSPASIDYFGVYSSLSPISLGEKVVFGMAGAYASSMGSGFSGVTRPTEYVMSANKLEVLFNEL